MLPADLGLRARAARARQGASPWLRRAKQVLFGEPLPLRFLLLQAVDRWFHFLPYPSRLRYQTIDRAHYGHCLWQAALLARRLGKTHISAIEFGVAGGNGLVALERHARLVREETGVVVDVYGFDTGTGMPPSTDHRDLPYLWQPGYFAMDVAALRARLEPSTRLILGQVEETVGRFLREETCAPIGFIAFDLDYYSSTLAAMHILEAEPERLLPRIACYLDDMVGDIDWAYNEFTGELAAVHDFNAAHEHVKIAPVRGLRFSQHRIPQVWHEQIFVAHLFRHPDYGRPVSDLTQLPLDAYA